MNCKKKRFSASLIGLLALGACAGDPTEDLARPELAGQSATEPGSEYPPDAQVVQMNKDLPFEEVLKLLATNHDKTIHSYTCSSIHYGIKNWSSGQYMSMRADGGNAVRAIADAFDAWEDFKLCVVANNGSNDIGGYALWSRQANSLVTAQFNWGSATPFYNGNPFGELVAGGATQADNWEIMQLDSRGVQGYAMRYHTSTQFFVSARYDYTGANYGMVRAGVVATQSGRVFYGDDVWEHWLFEAH